MFEINNSNSTEWDNSLFMLNIKNLKIIAAG